MSKLNDISGLASDTSYKAEILANNNSECADYLKSTELPIKVSVFTLGCKVNQYDSDAMLNVLKSAGMEVSEGLGFAQVYVINTCAVTAEAEKKSRQTVARILAVNPDAKIYVCGCASQNNFSQFAKDGVEYISGTDNKLQLAERIAREYTCGNSIGSCFGKIVAEDFSVSDKFEDNEGVVSFKTRHFIKVQDGCDNFCSYCIVPYLRGRSRSRKTDSILSEIEAASKTAKEVVITGINLSAYGKDSGTSLNELLLNLKDFGMRFRLGSLEVGIIDEEFLRVTKILKRFCPHFHLSLQSGDDGVLSAMNRRYTAAEYFKAAELIREYYPEAAITTDIIVGFPTESEEQFVNSLEFARKVKFSDIHVFPFSPRKGTVAAKFPALAPAVILDRQKRMTALKMELSLEYLKSQIGKPQEVLFETREDGMWCGHTPNYIKVYSPYGTRNASEAVVPTALYRDGVRV